MIVLFIVRHLDWPIKHLYLHLYKKKSSQKYRSSPLFSQLLWKFILTNLLYHVQPFIRYPNYLRFQCNNGRNSSLFGESHNNLLLSSLKNLIFCFFPYSFIVKIWIFHINYFVREPATPSCYCPFSPRDNFQQWKSKRNLSFLFYTPEQPYDQFHFFGQDTCRCTQDTKRIKKITFVF